MTSTIGYILSIQYANQPLHYTIIAEYRSKQTGLMHYVTPVWNPVSKKFIDYREDSYFFRGISQPSYPYFMSAQDKACSRAWHLQQELKESKQRIAMIKAQGGKVSTLSNVAVTSYRASFDMADRHTWQLQADEGDFIAIDSEELEAAKQQHAELDELFRAEMAIAKITI